MGGLFKEDWEDLTEARNVGSVYLTHLIRGRSDDEAYNTLLDILESGILKASFSERNGKRTIRGDKKVVCFQDSSFDLMNEVITGENWCEVGQKYREFGIQLDKIILFTLGARPVIYDRSDDILQLIDESIHWRVVNLDLGSQLQYTDWTHEREWRIPESVKLSRVPFRIIVKSEKYRKMLLKEPRAKKALDDAKKIAVFENEISEK